MSLFRISSLQATFIQNKNARFCVNHFAITNCVLKDISVKGFENVLQIFLRLKRLLTHIAHVNHLSTDI